jgi:hypothetical protein
VLHDDDAEVIIFVGSPWLTETSELPRLGVTLGDFAVSDPIIDYLLLLQQQTGSLTRRRSWRPPRGQRGRADGRARQGAGGVHGEVAVPGHDEP